MRKPVIELIAGIVVAALSIAGLAEAWGYSGETGLMPRAVLVAAVFLSLVWCLQSLRAMGANGEKIEVETGALVRFGLLMAGGAVYVLGIASIGFFTSTVIIVPAIAAGLGYRNWTVIALSTLGFVAVLYAVFRLLLQIPLPDEIIFTFFSGASA